MDFGFSSSCFYPMLVEDSLKHVGELGAKTTEVFMNSYCELTGPILKELCSIKDYYSLNIRSIHPFTSAYETILLFSTYDRRTNDGLEFYKRYFDAANSLGAKILVLHGGLNILQATPESYAESYYRLHQAALENGIHIAHENVREHQCANPMFMKEVADCIGDEFRLVLDIKQCRRSNVSEYDFIKLLGGKIAQVHISDFIDAKHDCLAPGKGKYDFASLFSALKQNGYNQSAVTELYSGNYTDFDELRESLVYLENV